MLLVNLEKIPTDRAAYGSKVVLYEYDTDKEVEYQLVTSEESDISKGLISITSPIGRSIVGKMAGDNVEIVTPSGKKDYELRSLRTIHEIETDPHQWVGASETVSKLARLIEKQKATTNCRILRAIRGCLFSLYCSIRMTTNVRSAKNSMKANPRMRKSLIISVAPGFLETPSHAAASARL